MSSFSLNSANLCSQLFNLMQNMLTCVWYKKLKELPTLTCEF